MEDDLDNLNLKMVVAGRQAFKCANFPTAHLPGLEGFVCPLWASAENPGSFTEEGFELNRRKQLKPLECPCCARRAHRVRNSEEEQEECIEEENPEENQEEGEMPCGHGGCNLDLEEEEEEEDETEEAWHVLCPDCHEACKFKRTPKVVCILPSETSHAVAKVLCEFRIPFLYRGGIRARLVDPEQGLVLLSDPEAVSWPVEPQELREFLKREIVPKHSVRLDLLLACHQSNPEIEVCETAEEVDDYFVAGGDARDAREEKEDFVYMPDLDYSDRINLLVVLGRGSKAVELAQKLCSLGCCFIYVPSLQNDEGQEQEQAQEGRLELSLKCPKQCLVLKGGQDGTPLLLEIREGLRRACKAKWLTGQYGRIVYNSPARALRLVQQASTSFVYYSPSSSSSS